MQTKLLSETKTYAVEAPNFDEAKKACDDMAHKLGVGWKVAVIQFEAVSSFGEEVHSYKATFQLK